MADAPDPNRPNPSLESTRADDAHDRQLHQHAEGMGAAAGTGLGCLGVATLPWSLVLFALLAAAAAVTVWKGCAGSS
jgi:hypothetical protein